MLRFLGGVLLLVGCIGTGWSMKEKEKAGLDHLYRMKHILQMLQHEIAYSRAPLPEACGRVAHRVEEPYRSAFLSVREEMLANHGKPFQEIWEQQMETGIKGQPVAKKDRKAFLGFGCCIGYLDGEMQAEAIEQYMHRLDLSIGAMEKDISNRCKVIMSLSIMGGLMLAIMLL